MYPYGHIETKVHWLVEDKEENCKLIFYGLICLGERSVAMTPQINIGVKHWGLNVFQTFKDFHLCCCGCLRRVHKQSSPAWAALQIMSLRARFWLLRDKERSSSLNFTVIQSASIPFIYLQNHSECLFFLSKAQKQAFRSAHLPVKGPSAWFHAVRPASLFA